MKTKENRRILIILVFLILLCMSLVAYLTYFEMFLAKDIVNRPENRRSIIEKNAIKRGSIYDRNSELLATTEGTKGNYIRRYTYPFEYAHVIGYSGRRVGDYQIEATYRDYLLGKNSLNLPTRIKNLIRYGDNSKVGNDLILTTNTELQKKSKEILDEMNEKGAIVTMNPKTGEIYSMISSPDFNAENIDQDIGSINERNQGSLVNKATMGKYAPGSTYKILTTVALLESKDIDLNYRDTGKAEIDGRTIKNAGGMVKGRVNLEEAFVDSLNTYFVTKSLEIGQDKMGEVADRFMFNKKIDFDIPLRKSIFDHSKKLSKLTLATTGMGQGEVTATPLQMCMVASTIANKGQMMQPYLVNKVVTPEGLTLMEHKPKMISQAVSEDIASVVKKYMVGVVNYGSGTNAYIRGLQVAGKTGTAETSSNNNAWFVGFAPADDPKIAVAVIVENVEDSGGRIAAPIAKDIIRYALVDLNVGE